MCTSIVVWEGRKEEQQNRRKRRTKISQAELLPTRDSPRSSSRLPLPPPPLLLNYERYNNEDLLPVRVGARHIGYRPVVILTEYRRKMSSTESSLNSMRPTLQRHHEERTFFFVPSAVRQSTWLIARCPSNISIIFILSLLVIPIFIYRRGRQSIWMDRLVSALFFFSRTMQPGYWEGNDPDCWGWGGKRLF